MKPEQQKDRFRQHVHIWSTGDFSDFDTMRSVLTPVGKEKSQMEMYHFVTNWFFQALIKRGWEEIVEIKPWPTWWASYIMATLRGPEPKLQLGYVVYNEVRGALPYSLLFTTEVTISQPPQLLEMKSSGDLVGTGKFVFEPRDNGTAVTCYWDVGTSNPLFNLLDKLSFVRAMIEKNHDNVMDEGYRIMKERVER